MRRLCNAGGSIGQFQRKLDLPRRPGCFADNPKTAAANDVRRQAKIHLVKNVKELGAKLQVREFAISAAAERRVLDQGHVELTEGRPAEGVAAERSENALVGAGPARSEEHTSELQSQSNLVCRLLLEKKKRSTIDCPTAASLIVAPPCSWSARASQC